MKTFFRGRPLSLLVAVCLSTVLLTGSCSGATHRHHVAAYHAAPPPISPATGLPNRVYKWRGQRIRYQVAEPSVSGNGGKASKGSCVLVHGLFVNGDHWRKTLRGLADAGYRAYAVDLLGCGYSSKPPRDSAEARALCGERGRFFEPEVERGVLGRDAEENGDVGDDVRSWVRSAIANLAEPGPSVLPGVTLGTSSGQSRVADVDLRHPLNSCYNFYTWAEQIADFTREVVLTGDGNKDANKEREKATLVCNSIGTISSLQSALDEPDLYDGVFVVNPNFRELHSAEVALPSVSMPIVRVVQRLLRERGRTLFDALANPGTVRQILQEPYKVSDAVDDELVDALLTPLLTEGAADVVFDTLSYSAGPLPEQQLAQLTDVPVWVCYGKDDPWTPPARVERLLGSKGGNNDVVERVVAFDGVGHCPMDEAPELVNPLLLEFLRKVKQKSVYPDPSASTMATSSTSVNSERNQDRERTTFGA